MPSISKTKPSTTIQVHTKSRLGCLECKRRKVKCDEQKPQCLRCLRNEIPCSYLRTHPIWNNLPISRVSSSGTSAKTSIQASSGSASPTATITTASPVSISTNSPLSLTPSMTNAPTNSFSMLDLEILHFWTTEGLLRGTLSSTALFEDLYRGVAVQLAFSFPFVMHQVLSLSALQMAYQRPEKAILYRYASDTHQSTALALLQPQLASLSSENCQACFIFSTLLFVHSFASQDLEGPSTLFFSINQAEDKTRGHVPLLVVGLHRGTNSILKEYWEEVRSGPFAAVFNNWEGINHYAVWTVPDEEGRHLDDLPVAWKLSATGSSLQPRQLATLDENLNALRGIFSLMAYHPELEQLSVVISWLSRITDELLAMLDAKIPQALLLVASYCVCIARLPQIWWTRGKARHLLDTVCLVLSDNPCWERWLAWPKRMIQVESPDG